MVRILTGKMHNCRIMVTNVFRFKIKVRYVAISERRSGNEEAN